MLTGFAGGADLQLLGCQIAVWVDQAPSTSVMGTTVEPSSSAAPWGNYAAESVTIFTVRTRVPAPL